MSMQVYLDNSATTRPCAQAVEAVAQSMTEAFHNPSALYAPAMRAEHALTDARRAIAATLGAQEKNVIFTSGGTESDNLAIWGRLSAMHHPGEVLYTAAEHEAVKNACLESQARYGVAAREIPLLPSGTVDLTALEGMLGRPFDEVAETIKRTAFHITRVGQLVALEASRRLNVPFGIVDLSLAPTPAVGDSVAAILEEMGLETCGAHGTTAALALLNDAVKKGGVMASSSVGGLSGAFIPVSEDAGMIAAVEAGALSLEKLEAMTCVCSVGLDMIAIPGDTPVETIAGIIADEMAIGVINNKTTAVRVIPAIGKGVGDCVEYGGLFGRAPIMPVNPNAGTVLAHRGGRFPAPLNSLKN